MSPEPKGETVWKLPPGKMTSATIPSCSSSARRRFESKAIGEQRVHACLGVYVIDGRAAGVYARVAERPLIDGRAQDAAVLLDPSLDPSLDATGDSTGDPPRTQRAASLSKELHHARH